MAVLRNLATRGRVDDIDPKPASEHVAVADAVLLRSEARGGGLRDRAVITRTRAAGEIGGDARH
jgi:hypothetical protein